MSRRSCVHIPYIRHRAYGTLFVFYHIYLNKHRCPERPPTQAARVQVFTVLFGLDG